MSKNDLRDILLVKLNQYWEQAKDAAKDVKDAESQSPEGMSREQALVDFTIYLATSLELPGWDKLGVE